MKLFIITGKTNGMLCFVHDESHPSMEHTPSMYSGTKEGWLIRAFKDVNDAIGMHDRMRHGEAKLCKVVEIEIPDDTA